MVYVWTVEKLASLDAAQLDRVKKNATAKAETNLANLCAELQRKRRTSTATRASAAVVGFHFVCKNDYEVEIEPDGTFWSGVWAIDEAHCEPAIKLNGYVALHDTKLTPSYRQGQIIDWRRDKRSKGSKDFGVSFKLRPLPEPIQWHGQGSGEKGYRRTGDRLD